MADSGWLMVKIRSRQIADGESLMADGNFELRILNFEFDESLAISNMLLAPISDQLSAIRHKLLVADGKSLMADGKWRMVKIRSQRSEISPTSDI